MEAVPMGAGIFTPFFDHWYVNGAVPWTVSEILKAEPWVVENGTAAAALTVVAA